MKNRRHVAFGPVLSPALGTIARNAFLNDIYHELVDALEAIIAMPVSGLIVYGSRTASRGAQNFGHADIDLLLLVDAPVEGGLFGHAGEVEFDLHLHSRQDALNGPVSEWMVYAQGQVLHDARAPELSDWIQHLQHWKHQNPDPWNTVDHLRNRVWAYRLVDRVARLAVTDPTAAVLHESRLLAAVSTLHAQVRHTYTTSISHWWRALTADEPAIAETITQYVAHRTYPPDAQALRALVDALYG